MPQSQPPSMTRTTASFSSGDSTLCSSPLSDLGDLPPLKNLPPLLSDPQMPEQIQVKKRPMTANFPIKARNPFKFRRTSTSSAPSPTPEIEENFEPLSSSIDRCSASPDPGPRKSSLIRRLNMKGRRAYSVNMATGCAFRLMFSPSIHLNNPPQLLPVRPHHRGWRRRHSATPQTPRKGPHPWTSPHKHQILRCSLLHLRTRVLGALSLVVSRDGHEQRLLHRHPREPNRMALLTTALFLSHSLDGRAAPDGQLPVHDPRRLKHRNFHHRPNHCNTTQSTSCK